MTTRVSDILLTSGAHASRPASAATGALFSCTDHSKIYRYSGSAWADWATLGSGGSSGSMVDRAFGQAYTLSATPNASYPDADTGRGFDGADWSANKLTDGNWGGTYTSGQSIGYDSGTTITVTFDLASAKNVALVIARGRFGAGGVYRPVSFQIEHSDDNSAWTSDLNVSGLTNGGQPGDDNWTAHMPIAASSHRYWRATFGRSNTAGHFLFLNAVELWG